MFLNTYTVSQKFSRHSKSGKEHSYTRYKTLAKFICDNCQNEFQRELGKMDRKRLSNEYHHVCPLCDNKRFAQQMGVERRRLWNISVDADIDISKI